MSMVRIPTSLKLFLYWAGIEVDQLEQEVERVGEHSGMPAGRERK